MSAEHFDEGIGDNDRHLHKFGIPKDENNKYCGNLLDAKLLSNINKNYPVMMRQRGWEMDDLDTTDWERYKEDEDYRLERKQKFRDNGKSVNKHITDKLNKELKKAQELTQQAQDTLDVAEQIKLEAEEEKRKNEDDAKAILKKSMELKKRESAISAKEQEQQKKADEFQHKEDALDVQQRLVNKREAQQNKREKALQAQEHFQDVNSRVNSSSVHRFDEYGNRI